MWYIIGMLAFFIMMGIYINLDDEEGGKDE